MAESCLFRGCRLPVKSRGYCGPHYEQLRRGTRLRPVRPLRCPGPWSFTALVERLGAPTKHDTCVALGINPSVYDTYMAGGLNDHGADTLATRAGLHPVHVWGWAWVTTGLTPLDEVFLECGWRPAWLWQEQAA